MKYVVGHNNWPNGPHIYTYGGEIQEGTLESAKGFLEYVKHMSPEKTWRIYEVEFKLVP